RAAEAHQADIVALSFSSAFPQRQIPSLLQQFRLLLPTKILLWVGGSGVKRLPETEGISVLPNLSDAPLALEAWRKAH
ncbi:MAG: MerR family transcriptional regulator, partial [Betaproteobacteria bacterium]|nr:MerR family transcriptional regulator [Betaproteobacteria bacterium]